MGGCSGDSGDPEVVKCFSEGGGQAQIEELVKAVSMEEAGRLIREGHVLMAVYWNCARSAEEYVLGRLKKKEAPARKVGFSMD